MWHLQPTTIIARYYDPDKSYADRSDFDVVANIDLTKPSTAYIHALLSKSGKNISKRSMFMLFDILKEEYQVDKIISERKGIIVEYTKNPEWTLSK